MFPSYLLALREGIEAALIVGIVLGTLNKLQLPALKRHVWAGTISAVVVSLLVGVALYTAGASFEGAAEEIFEGISMLIAAGILTWMIFWMRRRARTLAKEIEGDVRQAARQQESGGKAMFALAFFAVVREGIELALFIFAAALATDIQRSLLGAALGLVSAIVLGWLLFTSTVRLDLARFFRVTSILLILFAAGLVAHGVHEFNEAGVIPAFIEHVWDINHILPEKSVLGSILTALFGYNGNPSLSEVIAYLVYYVAILLGMRRNRLPSLAPREA